jgi:hypothetical protein
MKKRKEKNNEMAKTKTLTKVTYSDSSKKIFLANYADTVVYDVSGHRHTLCAIRFGGYSEQVEAMAQAINGGGSVYLELDGKPVSLNAPAKRYRKKTSHDGIYAEAMLALSDDIQQTEKSNEKSESESEEEPDVPIVQDLAPHENYFYTAQGDATALFGAIDRAVSVPLLPEFQEYVVGELKTCGFLKPLIVHSTSMKFDAWKLKCTAGDANIIEIVERGLREKSISIPGADVSAPMKAVESVTEYLTAFGPSIAERIKKLFEPLFDPARDELSPEVLAVNGMIEKKAGYSLYNAQLAVAEAIKRQLERHKAGLIIAECGAGKTKIGLTAIAAATAGLCADQTRRGTAKTFNIVLCPAHVADKWCREIKETLNGTDAAVVSGITGFDTLYEHYLKGEQSMYAVITKENARDGYMRQPAVVWNERAGGFLCPDCLELIEIYENADGVKYLRKSNQTHFKTETRQNHRCDHCGGSLWTALNPNEKSPLWVKIGGYGFVYRPQALRLISDKIPADLTKKLRDVARGQHKTRGAKRKFPLSTYIKNRYKGQIDGLIVDELHQYSNDSGQGDAMAELYGAAKKVVGMTATLINGYASGIFYLLYRLVPGLMEEDGQSHSAVSAFASEYGVVENIYEVDAAEYNSNRRASRRKKGTRYLPGVSPLVYSRFLLEYAAFLTLTDMGKDLPEYEEIPVALNASPEVMTVYREMQSILRDFMASDKKLAKKILSAYLNLLIAYPDQSYGSEPIRHPIDGSDIVTPPDIGSIDDLTVKDKAVLTLVKRKIEVGENVLIYTNWTRLDTQKKLLKLLTQEGYRTEILPAKVPPKKREQWVNDRLDNGLQVLISNPSLVETGLDLNAFTTLIFYDTGYKLFTLRQASRRSWRINQTAPRVEVYMLYYADTMQHKAIRLMGTKLAVASIIEGGFSEEGLAAMSQCDDMSSVMAKELMLGIKDSVDDVSSAFKRMAFLKPQKAYDNTVTFSDEPVTVAPMKDVEISLVEFTFDDERVHEKVTVIASPKPTRAVTASTNQITLFDYLEADNNDNTYQEKRAS